MRLTRSNRRAGETLSANQLESRETPAGIVTASLVNGVLTLTGDDAANVITKITFGAGSVTIIPDSTTTIDDLAVAGSGTVNTTVVVGGGTATTFKAAMKGGNDSITLDNVPSVSLGGGVTIDLGDGDNVLDFTTTGKIDLGSFGIKAADGFDTVNLKGGTGGGSQVLGAASLAFGFGASSTIIGDVSFLGATGVTVSGIGGTTTLVATNVNVTKAFTGSFGDATGKLTFNTSTLGSLKETGASSTATLNTVTVNGPLVLAGVITASLTANPTTVNGTVDVGVSNANGAATVTWKGVGTATGIKVHGGASTLTVGNVVGDTLTVSGPVSVAGVRNALLTESRVMSAIGVTVSSTTGSGTLNVTGTALTVGGTIAVTSYLAADFTGGAGSTIQANSIAVTSKARTGTITASGTAATVFTDVSVSGLLNATLTETAGTFAARNVKVTAQDTAAVTPAGTSLTVNGTLTVTGKLATNVTFGTSALSEVKGKMAVTGGALVDTVTTNSKFKADQAVSLKLGNGNNVVTLGDNTAPATFATDLSILTGVGTDTITIRRTAVTGKTSILTGAGKDSLTIEDGAVFTGTFTADVGGGDDTITVAQDNTGGGSPGPTLFNGFTIFLGNAGNDTLFLGRLPGGDAKSAVQFTAGSKIDGGLGLNVFDQTTAQATGQTIKNWP